MILREATREDLDILLAFEQGVVEAERPYNVTLRKEKIHYYDLESLMNSKDATLIVAEKDHEVIASGYALIKQPEKDYSTFKDYAYLGFMFVKPEHRGKGVNQLIVDELILWSRNKGISEIRLDVYDQNESAIKAYEKAGFEPLFLTMRLK
ncbi:GNAT family N-acetyltransferase [Chryseobacterium soli]|uniref:GNAT family N-acetyltransferase n=1 Tax=Chryseobacterium soli TaxID=445961 RepID=UPI0029534A80|nr:GNAT family N-acetyltransferase [Chryseobacterium soli]MDV7699404.1 GNAT family N-acetyltransferase [Chryseobacterium soli]